MQRPLKGGAPRKVTSTEVLEEVPGGRCLKPGKETPAGCECMRAEGRVGLAGYQDSDSTADKKSLQCGAEEWPAKV